MIETHRSGSDMARKLVTYMTDAKAIRAQILAHFNDAPSLKTIASYRGAYVKRQAKAKANATPISAADFDGLSQDSIVMGSRNLLRAICANHPHIVAHLTRRAA